MASPLPRKSPLFSSSKSTDNRPLNADDIVPIKAPSERDPLLGRGRGPGDTCRLAYCIFFLHGIGHLLPWNFFITAQQVRRPHNGPSVS